MQSDPNYAPEQQLNQDCDSPSRTVLPEIEREAEDRIHVGTGGQLVVPREDIGVDIDVGDDLDLAAMQTKKHRKPNRREWIALRPSSELTTRLLLHKPKADGMDTEYYYVASHLRGPILDELKPCRVFLYYSYSTKTHALWIVHVTIDNSWYESLQTLLRQPAEFFAEKAIRVLSDKPNSRYRVKHKPLPTPVTWPTATTESLLAEAIGADKFILDAHHPLYRDLIDGNELT
jgi:hypothetical protein